jgi:hypothetical protein
LTANENIERLISVKLEYTQLTANYKEINKIINTILLWIHTVFYINNCSINFYSILFMPNSCFVLNKNFLRAGLDPLAAGVIWLQFTV